MESVHVSIAGAGLGGLCLAQGLKRSGVAFDIFERDAAIVSRNQGYRIRIDAAGQLALAGSLPPELYALLLQTAARAPSGQFLDAQLEPVSVRVPETWSREEPGELMDLCVDRQVLREILMHGLEGRIHFAQAVEGYELADDGGVRLRLQNVSSILATHVLVGADGVNSRVRAQLVPEAEPVDSGSICIYGKAGPEEESAMLPGTRVVFAAGCALILDSMRFPPDMPALASRLVPGCVISPVADYLYWALIAPRGRFVPETVRWDNSVIIDGLRHLARGWNPELRRILERSDSSQVSLQPVRCGRPELPWPDGPVTLLGDAAHAMSPAGGIGASTAFQDAFDLSRLLAEAISPEGDIKAALAGYAARMRDRAGEAIAISERGAARLFGGLAG
ncbi:TPA: FAD-dependent monooxygenase [Pseudomonas aeruginosa]|nr:FAD-dependent monooxygenase [Pseudomonas aeruginosa]HCE6902400.1 FAD-dependent monooxygenase [Pseudomonas aeruginosa]HCE7019486.1 FAD-dependent monooxygenase [Pseudomonas aeruginosa]HCE7063352.1 FAD-dependent monooxygenase [Pseudomonas aeruginosa]HCE7347055.1 FAD-dependent monooxygenase [Pseudomonas aeruginosa]